MKNFQRTPVSTEGLDGYSYYVGDELCFVHCCSEGWIKLIDLEPCADSCGAIQVVREWKSKKKKVIVPNVDFQAVEVSHLAQGFAFNFVHDDWAVNLWQPMANMPVGQIEGKKGVNGADDLKRFYESEGSL